MNLFRKTVVMDVNILPSEYKASDKTLQENIKAYEKDFNVKVIPIDTSVPNAMRAQAIIRTI